MMRIGVTIRHQKTLSLTTVTAFMSQPCSVLNLVHLLRLNILPIPMIVKIHTALWIQMELSSLKMVHWLLRLPLFQVGYMIMEPPIFLVMVLIVMTLTSSSTQEPRIFATVSTTIALMVRTMRLIF